ncbi:hypothetical protein ACIQNU_13635 [Streptomyces sp. NPDC091292]|uniref:hypothetical protein n=1 Tax=Streptomyces sp. NPDC091292 TaxID=3365991 RepID=UPI003825855A
MNEDVIKAGVARDADYVGRLFRDLQAGDAAGISWIISLCMTPYLSIVLHEARRKPQAVSPAVFDGFSAEAKEVCARARHSLKLFEDTQRHIEGQLLLVTLYQVLLSLKILKEDSRYPLSPSSNAALETILNKDAAGVITDGAVREFRNTLMHYNLLSGADTAKVDLEQPVFGLVPQYFPSYDFGELSELVDISVRETAYSLNDWATGV